MKKFSTISVKVLSVFHGFLEFREHGTMQLTDNFRMILTFY